MSDLQDINTTKYSVMFNYTLSLNMRNVRDVYKGIRHSQSDNPDLLFPRLGITFGEFAVSQVMKLPRHGSEKKKSS